APDDIYEARHSCCKKFFGPRPPRYVSIYRDQVKREAQMNKPPAPQHYLIKHSKEPVLSSVKPFSYPTDLQRKPPVPPNQKRTKVPPTPADYVKSNIISMLSDTRNGDKKLLDDSGLIRKYVYKSDYGKTPKYLMDYKMLEEQAIRAEEEKFRLKREEQEVAAQKAKEELAATIKALREKWTDLNTKYQCMSISLDNLSKQRYKVHLELEMDQVEEDIRHLINKV
uniref:Enkurin domain-containing protein n=1 Tax=Denticeps clupeoides TaxID=299321 RepID=A0AAY4CM13_9TELE